MKNNSYLNQCLEQAAHSPLRQRHGCVVVKGGKIIGRGFNDYRPGYDGRALNAGPNVARKPNSKISDPSSSDCPGISDSGSQQASTCLSMHAEMMAIDAALASSSAGAARSTSRIKQGLKLPGRHTKPQGLPRSVQAYVERVCLEALESDVQPGSGAPQADGWRFEAAPPRCDAGVSDTESEPEPESEQEQENQDQGF